MYRIFIIEDDPTIAQTLKKHLEGWDYKVECAKDFHNITAEFAALLSATQNAKSGKPRNKPK